MTDKPLYAVAYEIYNHRTKKWIPADIGYIHANTQGDARFDFINSQCNDKLVNIVSIGLVIGYFVDDKQGNQLSL